MAFDVGKDFENQVKRLLDYKEKNGIDLLQRALAEAAKREFEKSSQEKGVKAKLSGKYNSMVEALDKLKKNEMEYEEYIYWAKEVGLIKDRSYLNK